MTDHTATPSEHSDLVGGSSASRVLGCTKSIETIRQLQASVEIEAATLDDIAAQTSDELEAAQLRTRAANIRDSLSESSSYADEGTGLHEVMAYLVANDISVDDVGTDPRVNELWEQYDLHPDRLHDAVIPALNAFNAYCNKLLEEGDDPYFELMIKIEAHCEMPGIDGAFGTTDILIHAEKRSAVWDWKFGSGVPVHASYKVDDVEYGNDQLSFYARAALNTYPDFFEDEDIAVRNDWPVDLIICQPRIGEGEPSIFTTNVANLENFRLDLIDAIETALAGKGVHTKGSWCRFAPCKAICPLHLRGPVVLKQVADKLTQLQLAQSTAPANVEVSVPFNGRMVTYPQALAMLLEIADSVEPLLKEAQKQAHAFMDAGGKVPGYKLVPKRAGARDWVDEEKADAFLARQGLPVDERRVHKPITPAVAEKKLKALGKLKGETEQKRFDKYVAPGVSSGTNVAPEDDKRPEVHATATLLNDLAEKIATVGVRG